MTETVTWNNWHMSATSHSLNPYKVEKIGTFDYNFVTDSGRQYNVNFISMSNYHADFEGVYMFNLYTSDKAPHPIDVRVAHTVVSVLQRFFECQVNSMVMICDNTDNKEAKRSKLFSRWFDTYGDDNISKFDASVQLEQYSIYASLYVHRFNPYAAKIIKAFKDIIVNEFYPV